MVNESWTPEQVLSWVREITEPKTASEGLGHPLASARLITSDWWKGEQFPQMGGHHVSFNPTSWVGVGLFRKALEGGKAVRVGRWEGNLIVPSKNLLETLQAILKVRVVLINDSSRGNGKFVFASDTTMIQLELFEMGRVANVIVASADIDVVAKSAQLFDKAIVPDDPRKGMVFMLAQEMGGYSVRRLGLAGTQLERGNYTDEVLADYDHIVGDLQTESPCGRLVIMAGPPGTGKTYIVRALLKDAFRASFVLIPAHLVSELSGPAILPALTSARNESKGPIVLIIEDADKVLVKRQDGEMNGISSMLNLGDGILGSALDIRILATTNAEKIEMDPATRRPGRLCRYIEVGPLDAAKANEAFQRLTGKPGGYDEATTIAQVYLDARGAGWVPPKAVPERENVRPEII